MLEFEVTEQVPGHPELPRETLSRKTNKRSLLYGVRPGWARTCALPSTSKHRGYKCLLSYLAILLRQ